MSGRLSAAARIFQVRRTLAQMPSWGGPLPCSFSGTCHPGCPVLSRSPAGSPCWSAGDLPEPDGSSQTSCNALGLPGQDWCCLPCSAHFCLTKGPVDNACCSTARTCVQGLLAERCSPKAMSNVLVSAAKQLTANDANHKEGFIVRDSLQGRSRGQLPVLLIGQASCTGQQQTYRQNFVVLKLPLL